MRYIFLITIMIFSFGSFSQQTERKLISTTGGHFSQGGFSLSFSLGELSISTGQSNGVSITQGFQQPGSLVFNSPLPLTLLAFTATLINNQTHLQWMTAQEINTSRFDVERSPDGQRFEVLTTVNATGNSSVSKNYATLDKQPYNGMSYYRLKMIDTDGSFTYSAIVYVKMNVLSNWVIYPNPAALNLHVQSTIASEQDDNWIIFDANGKQVLQQAVHLAKGNNTTSLNISALAAGYYILRSSKNIFSSIQFIKQ